MLVREEVVGVGGSLASGVVAAGASLALRGWPPPRGRSPSKPAPRRTLAMDIAYDEVQRHRSWRGASGRAGAGLSAGGLGAGRESEAPPPKAALRQQQQLARGPAPGQVLLGAAGLRERVALADADVEPARGDELE